MLIVERGGEQGVLEAEEEQMIHAVIELGERRLHEVMVPEDDARTTVELADRYVIQPAFQWFDAERYRDGKACADGFRYSSDNNDRWLSREELVEVVRQLRPEG